MLLAKGTKVFIRTVTYHHIGEVSDVTADFVTLKGACWVADSGRFADALESGTLTEVEVPKTTSGECEVSRGSIVDVWPWDHPLPKQTK